MTIRYVGGAADRGGSRYVTSLSTAARYPGDPFAGGGGGSLGLDNVLLHIDPSDSSTLTLGPGSVLQQIVSKDPEERVLVSADNQITVVGGRLVSTGALAQELAYTYTGTADPLFAALTQQLTGSIMMRVRATANENRTLFDSGRYAGFVDGVSFGGDQLRVYGDTDLFVASWTSIAGITQTLRGPQAEFQDVLIVLEGTSGTVYIDDESGPISGFVPNTDRAWSTSFVFKLMDDWTGEVEEVYVTSDTITEEEFAAFRAQFSAP